MKYNIKNLTGQKFGKLTVLKITNKRQDGGSIVWKCRCDCGSIVEISSKRLTTGMNLSCGCYQKERQKSSMKLLKQKQLVDNINIDLIKKEVSNKNSKSGIRGVHWCKSKKKWIATLSLNKKLLLNEAFKNKEDAIQARKKAEEKYFKPILDQYTRRKNID